MQQHIRTLILGTSICGALAVPATVSADVVYDDPDGRFSMTFLGDWATDAEDARWLAYGDMPLAMTVLTLETQDVAAAVEAGLRELGVDPATLTETTRTNWNRWLLLGFDHGEDQGLTVLAQPRDGSTVVIVGRGQRDLTNNPPQNIIATLETVRFAGAAQLPQSIPDFEAYVAEAMSGGPPGVSIAIANPGEIVYAKGFGLADGPDQTPATPGTVYQWGSVTKTVTATAIMQLVEQGKLDLDVPVSGYLDYVPADMPFTARNLLTHSSGLPEDPEAILTLLRLQGQPAANLDAHIRAYFDDIDGLMFQPGTTSAYANPNFILLGELVAHISGVPFEDYVRENIFSPLGLVKTDFSYATEPMRTDAAPGAIPVDQMPDIEKLIDNAQGPGTGAKYFQNTDGPWAWFYPFVVSEGGGGGLLGPVDEMVRFGQMFLNEGTLDGAEILSPESVAALRAPQTLGDGDPLEIGLSWHFNCVAPHFCIEHDGGGAGLQAKLRLYMDDGLAVAMMSNGAGMDRNEVADAAAHVYFTLTAQ